MKRREFIAGLAGATAWPVMARAQQTALPVIGFLNSGMETGSKDDLTVAFREGLCEQGFVEGGTSKLCIGGPNRDTINCRRLPRTWRGVGFL